MHLVNKMSYDIQIIPRFISCHTCYIKGKPGHSPLSLFPARSHRVMTSSPATLSLSPFTRCYTCQVLSLACFTPQGDDIFSYDFVFVPIHELLHWSLVIICHPGMHLHQTTMLLHLDSMDSEFITTQQLLL